MLFMIFLNTSTATELILFASLLEADHVKNLGEMKALFIAFEVLNFWCSFNHDLIN
jgi:hypothetical protein